MEFASAKTSGITSIVNKVSPNHEQGIRKHLFVESHKCGETVLVFFAEKIFKHKIVNQYDSLKQKFLKTVP